MNHLASIRVEIEYRQFSQKKMLERSLSNDPEFNDCRVCARSEKSSEPMTSAWCLILQGGESDALRIDIREDETNSQERQKSFAVGNQDADPKHLFAELSRLRQTVGNSRRIPRPQTELPALRGKIHGHRSVQSRLRGAKCLECFASPRRSIARTLRKKTPLASCRVNVE